MKELAIDVVQLGLKFDREEFLFRDLSFSIKKGEFVMIIGPNGSGKTSLVKAIMGIYRPVMGRINVYESVIGYVPQNLQKDQFSPMSVGEFFSLKVRGAGFWFQNKKKEIKEILALTNIEHVYDKPIKFLSGGEFQRVMIAYALIGNPGLLILDEPVSGIDIHGEQDFFEMIEKIHSQRPITIVMISHDIDIVYRYATQVICLNKSLVCLGAPVDVLTKKTIEKTFSSKHGLYHHKHDKKIIQKN